MRVRPFAVQGSRGFTLVEVLVAVLIVGVLAAIIVPSLLAARTSAGDAPAKALVHTAQLAAESEGLDNDGSYASVTASKLRSYEPTIPTNKTATDAWLSAAKGTASGYTLTATATATGDKFTLARNGDATFTRSCTIRAKTSPHGGCENVKGTKGVW